MKDWQLTIAIAIAVVLATALLVSSTHKSCCERWAQTEIKLNKAVDNQVKIVRSLSRVVKMLKTHVNNGQVKEENENETN